MPSPRPTTLVQVESEDWHPNIITEINRIQQHKCNIHLLRLPQAGPRQSSHIPSTTGLHTCLIKQAFILYNTYLGPTMTWLISVIQLFSNRQTDRNISPSICTGRTFENHTTNWSRRLSFKSSKCR